MPTCQVAFSRYILLSYISHLFPLRRLRTVQTIPILKSRDGGADMRFRNNSAARNPSQGFMTHFQFSYIEAMIKKKMQIFLLSFNLPKCIVVGSSMMEWLLVCYYAARVVLINMVKIKLPQMSLRRVLLLELSCFRKI